jgi:hypothetical protein
VRAPLYKQTSPLHLVHRPGIEPGPPAWQASILPLNQHYDDRHHTIKFALFNIGNKEMLVKHGQKIGHLIIKESLAYPMIGDVYPDSDDDAGTECGCNGLSNKFEKFKLDKE